MTHNLTLSHVYHVGQTDKSDKLTSFSLTQGPPSLTRSHRGHSLQSCMKFRAFSVEKLNTAPAARASPQLAKKKILAQLDTARTDSLYDAHRVPL